MKTPIHLFLFLFFSIAAQAQITSPVARANFGVDAELRANTLDGFSQYNDDWFNNGVTGTGQMVIDTNGAAAMYSRYLIDPAYRKLPFYRTMRVPQFTVVNNRLWIDAVYIRDYNGQAGGDSTAFVTSNKNGDNPAVWSGGVTSVLDKNDIADMMIHVRRAGANKTDSLWFFGGLSLQGTSGNRYFDFELYQTDIFYTRSTGQFSNYGPDAGHTSWQFDASGNITKPGDVIFSAEYSSSSLTNIEARIWVNKSALSIVSPAFDWGGSFDGASTGSIYGYASIKPKSAGAYYTGLQSGNNTWAGPFGFIDGGNNVVATYSARQYMEFSVNLSKLGLDPITLLGGSACGLPFRRILVKTRSSTSFSSELKDFIGPFDFFKVAPIEASTNNPLYCGVVGVSQLNVLNPLPSSVYTWSTLNGNFVGDSVGASVMANQAGRYIVSQQLLDGCGTFSRDTVDIVYDANCIPMEKSLLHFKGKMVKNQAQLQWSVTANNNIESFTLQRSADGINFKNVQDINGGRLQYNAADDVAAISAPYVFYRLLLKGTSGSIKYSEVIQVQTVTESDKVFLYPNPANNYLQLSLYADNNKNIKIEVMNMAGNKLYTNTAVLSKGANNFTINETAKWQPGMYLLAITLENRVQWLKFIVNHNPAAE